MHEINVTPFIDVMLVLLIIFMVAAPLATVDIPVNLPASTAEPQPRPDKPLFLTVKSDLTLALGNDPVSREGLRGTLDAAAKGDKDTRIFLRADKTVPYGEVMEVMNLLRARRLSQGRAGRAGEGDRAMMGLGGGRSASTSAAGLICGAVVVGAHAGFARRHGHLERQQRSVAAVRRHRGRFRAGCRARRRRWRPSCRPGPSR